MKKLLKPFKRHSREVDEQDAPREGRSETRGRRSEANDTSNHAINPSHNTPSRPSTAAIAPAHPAVAVNGSGSFMNTNDLIANNTPILSKSPKLGGDEKFMTQPHRRRYSEDVADRNLSTATPQVINGSANANTRRSSDLARKAVPGMATRQQPSAGSSASTAAPNGSAGALRAARVASRPVATQAAISAPKKSMNGNTIEAGDSPASFTSPDDFTNEQGSLATAIPIRKASLSKRPSGVTRDRDVTVPAIPNARNGTSTSLKNGDSPTLGSSASTSPGPAVQSSHQNSASLPKVPLTEPLFANQTSRNAPFVPDDSAVVAPAVKRLPSDLRLPDGFSLQDTVDVDRSTTHAPAVTHEVVQPTVHHIRHEIITREIHNHDVYHRILPIVDVRILPARHYILDSQNDHRLKEVPECCVPGRTNDEHRSWTILETCSRFPELWSKDRQAPTERVGSRFTARTFAEKEGDTIEWVGTDGVSRSERTWIHPPVSSPWGREHGGTEPLYLDDFAPQPEIKYDYHLNGVSLKDMSLFDPSKVHDHSFEETPELRHINGKNVIAERTETHNPISRPSVVSRHSSRTERLRLVDDSFDDHRREPGKIETVNAGMTRIAV